MKKKKLSIMGFLLGMITLFSCSKDNTVLPSGGTSITIVNAIVVSSALVPNFNYNLPLVYYSTSNSQISYGNSIETGSFSGSVPLSLAQITDTTHTLFKNIVSLPVNTIQSL